MKLTSFRFSIEWATGTTPSSMPSSIQTKITPSRFRKMTEDFPQLRWVKIILKNISCKEKFKRALQKIAESEEIGAQTASELYRQREVLER